MVDVFVSYARPDEPHAKRVADELRAQGYSVWRDDEMPAHRVYAEVIQERLKSAKAVVVLWSAEAAKSQWVRSEADAARQLGTVVQATVDGSLPPMPFDQIQCADLTGWDGGTDEPGWRTLEGSVEALAGPSKAHGEMAAPRTQAVSICVLPFANMSGDPEQEYFSDGISEDITTDLSKVSALEVIARNTAFQFKGQAADVSDIAKRLRVSHVLEGSVRKAGNRVRITAQLIDGRSGGHVWAERYDRDLTDIFAIQDEISKAIVSALKINLLPEEKKAIENRGTTSPEAYDLYLLARQYWISGNWGDIRQVEMVIRICQRVVEIDPDYAKAWGLMSLMQSILRYTFGAGDDDGLAAADRALSMDPTIAEAYCVRARHLYEAGQLEESDRAIAQALKLEPDSWEVNHEAGRLFYLQRRLAEATGYYEKAVLLDETDYHTWSMLSSIYEALGDREGVLRAAKMVVSRSERAISQDPTNGAAFGSGATGLAVLGETERVKEWIQRALLINPDNQIMRYNFACLTALHLQDTDAAIDLLEPIFMNPIPVLLKNSFTDPDLDRLRESPRFRRMLHDACVKAGLDIPQFLAGGVPHARPRKARNEKTRADRQVSRS